MVRWILQTQKGELLKILSEISRGSGVDGGVRSRRVVDQPSCSNVEDFPHLKTPALQVLVAIARAVLTQERTASANSAG
jgi:hypothetical protein